MGEVDVREAMEKMDRGDHLTDREVEVLFTKFGEVSAACSYIPRYAVVKEDAIHKQNRLGGMIEGRKRDGIWGKDR